MNDPLDVKTSAQRRPRRWLAGVALGAAFVVGGLTMPMLAAQARDAGMHAMMGGSGHAAMHAMAMAHIQKMLDEVGATPEQKAKIDSILRSGFGSMMSMHQSMEDTHRQLHALLTAPTVDRNALEQLRAAQIAQLDQASRAMVQAMADAADVLTPEQRAKLGQLMKSAHPPS